MPTHAVFLAVALLATATMASHSPTMMERFHRFEATAHLASFLVQHKVLPEVEHRIHSLSGDFPAKCQFVSPTFGEKVKALTAATTMVARCDVFTTFTAAEISCMAGLLTVPESIFYYFIALCPLHDGATQCISYMDLETTCSSQSTNQTGCAAIASCVWVPPPSSDAPQSLAKCTQRVNAPYVAMVCSSCISSMAAVTAQWATTILADVDPAAASATSILFIIDQMGAGTEMLRAMTDAMCVTSPSGQRCIDVLGMNPDLLQDLAGDDPTPGRNADLPLFMSPALVDTACGTADATICFRQVVQGLGNARLLNARQQLAVCTNRSTADKEACQDRVANAQNAVSRFAKYARTVCTHTAAGTLCLAQAAVTAAANPVFADCSATVAITGICTANCSGEISQAVSSWGCCGRAVVDLSAPTNLANCASFADLNASLPQACAIPQADVSFRKTLILAVKWADIMSNDSLQQTIIANLVDDLSARLGLAPQDLLTPILGPQGGPTQAASTRHLTVLAAAAAPNATTANTQLAFSVSGGSNAEAQTASTSFDQQAANGISLPLTSSALQSVGLLAPGAPVAPANLNNNGGSDDKSKTALIAGLAAGGTALVLIVVGLLYMRKSAGRRAPEDAPGVGDRLVSYGKQV